MKFWEHLKGLEAIQSNSKKFKKVQKKPKKA
jgi:hypothetical protein